MTFGYHPVGAPTCLRKQEVGKSSRTSTGCTSVDIGGNAHLELVDIFCYLGDMYITLHFVSSDFYTADVFYYSLLYILCSRYI